MCTELAYTINDNRAAQLSWLCQLLPVVHQRVCHDLVSEGAKHSKKKAADVSRLWGPKHQEAFEALKGAMTTAPVLGYADYTNSFWRRMPAMMGSTPSCPRNRMGRQECLPLPAGASGPVRKTVHSTAA